MTTKPGGKDGEEEGGYRRELESRDEVRSGFEVNMSCGYL